MEHHRLIVHVVFHSHSLHQGVSQIRGTLKMDGVSWKINFYMDDLGGTPMTEETQQ